MTDTTEGGPGCEARGLVERVARAIAEYPQEWNWWHANAEQRERYERIANAVIAMVTHEVCVAAEERGRDGADHWWRVRLSTALADRDLLLRELLSSQRKQEKQGPG